MTTLPTMYVFTVEGDTTDADYTGVTKRVTATGAEYRIVGPLAEVLKKLDDNLTREFDNQSAECLQAAGAMADEIKRLRDQLLKITTSDQYKAAWDNGWEAALGSLPPRENVHPDLAKSPADKADIRERV